MNTDNLQQEILLFTNTTFSKRQLYENDAKDDNNHWSEIEKLEQACWLGLLGDLLPEIIENKKLSLWTIGRTEFSLQIELAEYPSKEKRFSLDPQYFLNETRYN